MPMAYNARGSALPRPADIEFEIHFAVPGLAADTDTLNPRCYLETRSRQGSLRTDGEQTQAIAGDLNHSRTVLGEQVPHRLMTSKGNHLVARR